MDTVTLVIVGVLAIAAIAATLYALNRSWGNFPRDERYRPPSGAAAPGISAQPSEPARPSFGWDTPAEPAPAQDGDLPDPPSWVVPITHPLVRRSAEQALAKGGAAARYVVRQGDQIAFDFSQISDPVQRRRAYAVMQGFADGKDVDMRAMLEVVRQLF
jgi:hypothetical protein